MKHIPNAITILRILLVPLCMYLMYSEYPYAFIFATFFFIVASVTDILDGYIARKYKLVSNIGKVLDPVADKIIVTAAMVVLVDLDLVPAWLVVLMLFRDFAVGALRDVASASGTIIAAGFWGKMKTIFQMVALSCIIFNHDLPVFPPFGINRYPDGSIYIVSSFALPVYEIGMGILYVSLALSIYSGIIYFKNFVHGMKGKL
ncbi:MAG: CDP-diacylglycerol--glycerol-3-phosphate 3-phosphatidyltransferase [Deferribacteraceae bacterium]|jgi:CDP-diacylglycerol--glycerol-3-phosphate 3-phosphatidyltransferase|nr:CDP-diacylglycerol--glycerol-3-phosphate 3-phosphatidyltransferase [Deferribacteraceae bacterium]